MPGATLDRIVVRMDGWPGAPGFMTFYSTDGTLLKPAVDTFVDSISSAFPSPVTFTVPAEGDIINDASGALEGSWTAGAPHTHSGGGATLYSAPSGACISWTTAAIVTGASGRPRRLRGRTFLVPLGTTSYDTDGTIVAAALSTLRSAASTLWTTGDLQIWHRPTAAGASDGSSSPVVGSDVKDRAAVLRSRRA